MGKYNKEFYDNQVVGSRRSASKIIPYVVDKLSPIEIHSLVDFGCGVGGWLSEFKAIDDRNVVKGMDFGDAQDNQLLIDKKCFEHLDLSKRINLDRKYDMAMSVEVAEHLQEEYADIFVDNLCAASNIVLFSAAIPGQGGVEHVNEQPYEYWINKFKERGYICYDIIRPHFWDDKDVEVWYRQNTFLYIKEKVDINMCSLKEYDESIPNLHIINPELLVEVSDNYKSLNTRLINTNYIKIHYPFIYTLIKRIRK